MGKTVTCPKTPPFGAKLSADVVGVVMSALNQVCTKILLTLPLGLGSCRLPIFFTDEKNEAQRKSLFLDPHSL